MLLLPLGEASKDVKIFLAGAGNAKAFLAIFLDFFQNALLSGLCFCFWDGVVPCALGIFS